MPMLWAIVAILVILWLLGFVAHIAGAFIHLVLVIAVIVLIVQLVSGRRRVWPSVRAYGINIAIPEPSHRWINPEWRSANAREAAVRKVRRRHRPNQEWKQGAAGKKSGRWQRRRDSEGRLDGHAHGADRSEESETGDTIIVCGARMKRDAAAFG